MPIQPEDFQIDLFDKVDEAITQIGKLKLEVGWFEGAKYDADTPVAAVAAQNEYGNEEKNIPPRPFIRPTVASRTRVWKGYITRNSKKVVSGDLTVDQMMETLGLVVAGDIRKTITQIHAPPLSETTLAARRKIRNVTKEEASEELKKPLVFEAFLMNSVSYAVGDEGEVVSPFEGAGKQ